MITGERSETRILVDRLVDLGYTFTTGVPCSLFGDLYAILDEEPTVRTVPAAREDCAIGVAFGATLAGEKAVVTMQNSALGVVINATQSLIEMYGVHLLLLVTWRGKGADAPEHLAMGERMPAILEAAGLPWAELSDMESLDPEFFVGPGPRVLVVSPGDLSSHG